MENLFGRSKIHTAAVQITAENVVEELNKVLPTHFKNKREEDYLYWYRRGKQPILYRQKEIRPEINNKIVENIADEIVSFKNGYFLTKPTFYVSRKGEESDSEEIVKLNDYLYLAGKAEADNNLVDWFHTVGLGVLYVEATGNAKVPARVYAIDPRQAFVVYSCRPNSAPMMGVSIVIVGDDETNNVIFDVWTETEIFHIAGGTVGGVDRINGVTSYVSANEIISREPNAIGKIPIIEYSYNRNRMGAFENVIGLCDSVNEIQSDRENGVQQFIQSLLLLKNCTLGDDVDLQSIREAGLIELKSVSGEANADIEILAEQLDQTQTQVFIDDIIHQICNIAGMPFTSDAGTSDGSNNGAVYLRNGWQTADTFARNTEDLFRESNKRFDEIFLKILEFAPDSISLDASDVDIQFTRNELENLLVKTQGAINLKELGLSPEIVLAKSGISNDPAGDVARSKEYIEIAFKTSADVKGEANNENDGQRDSGYNQKPENNDASGNN